jgi:hypothetical protein
MTNDELKRGGFARAASQMLRTVQLNEAAQDFLRDVIESDGKGGFNYRSNHDLELKLHDLADDLGIYPSVLRASATAVINYLAPIAKRREKGNRLTVKRPAEIVRYSNAIIIALEDALENHLTRHHNNPPDILRIDDTDFKSAVREQVAALKKLNILLSRKKGPSQKAVIQWAKHFNTFLKVYAGTLGKGFACLTVAAAASILFRFGIGENAINSLWEHVKLPK